MIIILALEVFSISESKRFLVTVQSIHCTLVQRIPNLLPPSPCRIKKSCQTDSIIFAMPQYEMTI